MIEIGKYWRRMAPREQWLALGIGLFVAAASWQGVKGFILEPRFAQAQGEQKATIRRMEVAMTKLKALQEKVRQGADQELLEALREAEQHRESYLKALEQEVAFLVTPQQMASALRDILSSKPGLSLLSFENTTEPFEVPLKDQKGQRKKATETADPILYRHGIRMVVTGSYFDVHDYLKSVEQSGRQLFWGDLTYQVEGDYRNARITIELYTLSREARWIGV